MVSYTSSLRATKQDVGSNNDTWGTVLNGEVIDMFDEAIAGWEDVSIGSTSVSLTTNNGSTDQARNAMLEFTGTLTDNTTVTIPSVSKLYHVWNNTSGAYTLTVKTSGGTGAVVQQGNKTILVCDGTDTYDLFLSPIFVRPYGPPEHDNGNKSGAVSIDLNNGIIQKLTLNGNATSFTVTNWPSNRLGYITVKFIQDGTGGRTLALGSQYRTAGSDPTLSIAASAEDILYFWSTDGGTTVYVSTVGLNFT